MPDERLVLWCPYTGRSQRVDVRRASARRHQPASGAPASAVEMLAGRRGDLAGVPEANSRSMIPIVEGAYTCVEHSGAVPPARITSWHRRSLSASADIMPAIDRGQLAGLVAPRRTCTRVDAQLQHARRSVTNAASAQPVPAPASTCAAAPGSARRTPLDAPSNVYDDAPASALPVADRLEESDGSASISTSDVPRGTLHTPTCPLTTHSRLATRVTLERLVIATSIQSNTHSGPRTIVRIRPCTR